MNELEFLMSSFQNDLTFIFRKDMPDSLHGLMVENTIYINANLPFRESVQVLAEEIGHHKTLPQGIDITDYSNLTQRKLEIKGREWGYGRLVPVDKLNEYVSKRESVTRYELAEEFGVTDDYVQEVIETYKRKGII